MTAPQQSAARADTGSHVGLCRECGGIVAASVDDPTDKKNASRNARFVADLVRRGELVSYTTCEAVRTGTWCTCTDAAQSQPELSL